MSRLLYASLIAFTLGYLVFLPRVFLVVDEERYVSQAVAFSQGDVRVAGAEIIHPPTRTRLIADFPPGTSLLQTPFVWIGGWRFAGLLSVIGLIVTTLATAQWLRESGYKADFALLVPGFFGALFFARLGMSDVPAAAVVALTAWAVWRAERRELSMSFLAGLLAGATLLFREPPFLLVMPLVVGALIRHRRGRIALVAGGVAAVALRLGLSEAFFGSATYVRDSGYGFSLSSLRHSLRVYGVILLLMLPGGALLPFFYRGPRRAELVTAVSAYVLLFLLYEYDGIAQNGPAKGVILASRYMVPALPLLAYMAADVWPRWLSRLSERWQRRTLRLVPIAGAAVVVVAFLIHVLARTQESVPLGIARALYAHTDGEIPIITNTNATLKYLSPAYGPRKLIVSHNLDPDSARLLITRVGGRVRVALLDRSDSELFRKESGENDALISAIGARCDVRAEGDSAIASWARIRIFEASLCR